MLVSYDYYAPPNTLVVMMDQEGGCEFLRGVRKGDVNSRGGVLVRE